MDDQSEEEEDDSEDAESERRCVAATINTGKGLGGWILLPIDDNAGVAWASRAWEARINVSMDTRTVLNSHRLSV